ncbi:uncharacterized protein LOC129761887 isoform X2 [Toxorhynchites rutilus septentrionalis]|uniref:uncharacterized protein LOC129761887 isoform X2 n=1 Tax=Toxorhynchites rutilus septentrionalis TaxID=329112 RepID=UPI002479C3C4|nr:uncharacterized protein LOC129761887 isoform X2 [Toxorhynchites rutilus septentrionalis]
MVHRKIFYMNRELENVAARENLSRARLLLEEWGSWGRRGERPTLGHLLELLTKNNMFYEADNIADLLGEPHPKRPHSGPAAPIDVEQLLVVKLEKELDGMPYPDSTAFQSLTMEENLDHPSPQKGDKVLGLSGMMPDSIIDGSLPSISNSDNNEQPVSVVGERPMISDLLAEAGPSGMNRISILSLSENAVSSSSEGVIDESSSTAARSENVTGNISYPNLSAFRFAGNRDLRSPREKDVVLDLPIRDNNELSASLAGERPMLSDLLAEAGPSDLNNFPIISLLGNTLSSTSDNVNDDSSSSNSIAIKSENTPREELPTVLNSHESNEYIPDLSILRQGSSESSLESSRLGDSGVPDNQATAEQQSNEPTTLNSTVDSDLIQFSSCVSAFSSLNSFSYTFLKTVTEDFDNRCFSNRNLSTPNGRMLGKGGFGEVFLGLNLSSDISVAAVKRLLPSNYKYREKFDLERDILSKNVHPNIVKLIGYSEDECLCLIYEYMPDGTLEVVMDANRTCQLLLPAALRLGYLCGIASAIEYLHDRQVIHRDVTLANILLQGSTAKLGDFGLVKRVGSVTATQVTGTWPYLAPEALRASVTSALDVYSFGVVLAEVVTGESVLVCGSPDNGGDLLERVMDRGTMLGAMIDCKVRSEEVDRWMKAGRVLLELSRWCLRERAMRPSASEVSRKVISVRDGMFQ